MSNGKNSVRKISDDPMGAFHDLRWFLQKYVTSAFGTNSPSFEDERQQLLDGKALFSKNRCWNRSLSTKLALS